MTSPPDVLYAILGAIGVSRDTLTDTQAENVLVIIERVLAMQVPNSLKVQTVLMERQTKATELQVQFISTAVSAGIIALQKSALIDSDTVEKLLSKIIPPK